MSQQEPQIPFATIDTQEAKKMLDAGARLIDVRRPEEWNQGHIAGATLLPVEAGIYAFGKGLQDLNLPADEPVIFQCASGRRSLAACEIALLTGLKKVYNLADGIQGWVYSGLPIER